MTDEELQDEALGRILLDLFTEAATIEHLMRERYGHAGNLTPQQFGLLNRFVRLNKREETVASLAFAFQVELDYARDAIASLVAKGMMRVDPNDCVTITDAGIAKHGERMAEMAADIRPIMAEFSLDELRTTATTLVEIRRTLDNLPDR